MTTYRRRVESRKSHDRDGGNLFGCLPAVYPHDPGWKATGTSRDAARAIAPTAKTVRANVLRTFREEHPRSMTADEVGRRLGISLFTVRPRVSELHAAEMIEQTDERRKNDSGHSAVCWRATSKAMEVGNG